MVIFGHIFRDMPSSIPRITAWKICKTPVHMGILGLLIPVLSIMLGKYQFSISEIKGGKSQNHGTES